MKKNLSQILLVLIIACSCSKSKTINDFPEDSLKSSQEELEIKNKKLTISLNHLIAQKYLRLIKQQDEIIPLGAFGYKEVEKYWSSVPELKEYRTKFEESDDKLYNFIIKNDNRYLQSIDMYKRKEISIEELIAIKYSVYKNLEKKYPLEYGKYRKDRDSRLKLSNLKTLEFIIADYHQKEILFPVKWLPNQILSQLSKDSDIRKISNEIEQIQKELKNKNVL